LLRVTVSAAAGAKRIFPAPCGGGVVLKQIVGDVRWAPGTSST
jgi:hypothetical protein